MNRIQRLSSVLLLALASLVVGSGGAHAVAATETPPDAAQTASFGPGRFGALVVPLSAKEAIATGMAHWTSGPCGRRLSLVTPYAPKVFPITTTTAAHVTKVIGVATGDGTYRTRDGLGVGSTLRELRSFYGDRLSEVRAGLYDVRYVEVRNSQKSLVFLFTADTTSNGSAVTGVSVARGAAITGWDGC